MASLSVLHILRTIKEHGTLSRTDLQQMTRLSWGTITNTTRELLDRNLIREEGTLQTKAGRKPMRLAINPTSHGLVGVDLAPSLIRCIALNLAGETLDYRECAAAEKDSPHVTLEHAAQLVRETLRQPAVSGRVCLGVGVAAQGAVDVHRGVMKVAPRMPGWHNVPIREYLQLRVSVPVLLEHDPNCLALAERWFGEASAADDVLCINLGEGVGMGILHKGEIFRGAQDMAGEFGHTTLDPNGPPCACGDRGCVETYCSVPAVLEAARHLDGKLPAALRAKLPQLSVADLVESARAGEGAIRELFTDMGRHLGLGVANVIDLFNPSMVILCGQLAAAAEFFLPALDEQVARHAWKHARHQTVISTLGDRALAIGACGTVLQSLFEQDAAAGTDVPALQRA